MKNKTVLITGASAGIGRAALLELAGRGCNVVGVSLKRKEMLEEAVKKAESFGVRACAISGTDVGDYGAVEKNIYGFLKDQGIEPDAIINNAGISHIGLLQDMSIEQWNRILATNLTSVFNVSRVFIPDMIKRGGGRIVNVSSVWGNTGASCEAAYSASKGGVNSLTKALAKELAPANIQVNAVAFGAIDTQMNAFLSEEERKSLKEEIPAGRLGNVQEAAKLLADVLESPAYLTGQVITMDGGWS